MLIIVLFADNCWPLVTILAVIALSAGWCLAILFADWLDRVPILLMIVRFSSPFTRLWILNSFVWPWWTLVVQARLTHISLLWVLAGISISSLVIVCVHATLWATLLTITSPVTILTALLRTNVVSFSFPRWRMLMDAIMWLGMWSFWAILVYVNRFTSPISVIRVLSHEWRLLIGFVEAFLLVVLSVLFLAGWRLLLVRHSAIFVLR